MSNHKRNTVLAGAIAMAFASGSVLAAGAATYTLPYDGADNGGGDFTIENALFDPNNVTAAPCPTGATCTNMTATQAGGNLLMREVDTGAQRYIQMIVTDVGGSQGDFAYEGTVSSGGSTNAIGAMVRIDDAAEAFHTTQAMYRGLEFGGNSNANNNITIEVHQNLDSGFQTFDMMTNNAPNQGGTANQGNPMTNGRLQILQAGAGNMQAFGHTILAGTFQTNAGTLTLGAGSFTFANGNALSATWIGGVMSGGGPGVVLAPGQTQNHDTRTAAQRDFGLLIYRRNGGATMGAMGAAGGAPAGIQQPQFSQNAATFAGGLLRGFSLDTSLQDTGLMYNVDHGSFIGGAAILADNWNATVFGANPY